VTEEPLEGAPIEIEEPIERAPIATEESPERAPPVTEQPLERAPAVTEQPRERAPCRDEPVASTSSNIENLGDGSDQNQEPAASGNFRHHGSRRFPSNMYQHNSSREVLKSCTFSNTYNGPFRNEGKMNVHLN
jgi:hypothetical protein